MNGSHPLVSVLTPTCDPERLPMLRRALQSLTRQTYPCWEAIVIADGVQAKHVDILEKEIRDARVRVLRKERRSGPGAARNLGARTAEGTYLAFLDDDDEWLPNNLSVQVAHAHQHPEAAFLFSDVYVMSIGGVAQSFAMTRFDGYPTLEGLCARNFIPVLSCMVKREIFEAVGCFDESRQMIGNDDHDLWLRILASHPCVCIPEPLAIYYYHGDNYYYTRKFQRAEIVFLHKQLRLLRNRPECRTALQYRLEHLRQKRSSPRFRMAYEAHEESYQHLLHGRFQNARKSSRRAISHQPLRVKNYLYWLFTYFPPSVYAAARRFKRKVFL